MIYYEKDSSTVVLKFYGDVGGYYVSTDAFTSLFATLDNQYANIEIRVHSYGGQVFEGTVIYNCLINAKANVTICVDGVSASMMTIVMLGARRILAADNALFMIHAPQGGTTGNAKDMAQTARLLSLMEDTFAKRYSEKTGKSDAEVRAWFDGTDHWFSAQEAKAMGLIDEIVPAVVKNVKQLDKPNPALGVSAVFNRYAALLHYTGTIPSPALNLSPAAVADYSNPLVQQVMAALKSPRAEWSWEDWQARDPAGLTRMEDENPVSFWALYSSKYGSIPVEGRSAIAMLTGTAPQSAAAPTFGPMPAPAQTEGNIPAYKMGWDWEAWQANDPQGIEAMEDTDPAHFATLYRARYGVTPSIHSGAVSRAGSGAVNPAAQATMSTIEAAWTFDEWQEKGGHKMDAVARVNEDHFAALYKAKYGVWPDLYTPPAPGNAAVQAVLNRAAQAQSSARAAWDFDAWNEKDPRGLERMYKENHAQYSALHQMKYGVPCS